jgi:ABC-type branched-subunit amino acid transport system substrate-binding protein
MQRLLAILLGFALLTAPCGRDSEDSSNDDASSTTVAEETDSEAVATTAAPVDGDDPDDSAPATTEAVVEETMIGTLASPCGAGDAAGETDSGVSDTAIKVGIYSDHTADAVPGLNTEVLEAAEAFVAWCNSEGGIGGRTVEAEVFESKLFEANQRAAEACEADVFVMLGAAALDTESGNIMAECGLPYYAAFTGSKPAIESGAAFPAIPTPYVSHGAGEGFWFAEQFPDEIKKAGVLFSNFSSSLQIAARAQAAYEAAGFEFIHEGPHSAVGETNWTPVMQPFKEAGVEVIVSMAQTEFTAAFLLAAAEQDYFPLVLANSANFTDDLITEGGDAVENVYTYSGGLPLSEATPGSAGQFYLDILDEFAGGAEPALLGVNALASTILFAHVANECGSDLTRACLATTVEGITEWDSGGLHGVTNPGERLGTPCYMMLQVVGGSWERVSPTQGLDCEPSNIVDTDIDYGE